MRNLGDYQEFLSALYDSFVENSEFHSTPDFAEIMKLPRMVVAFNHSTPFSWIPAAGLLTKEACAHGGADRIPIGIADKWLYSNPITKIMAEYLTQSDRHLSFDEIVEKFQHSERMDLAVMPEGANTFFGNVHEVQTFRSPRFVEIAVLSQAPILLVVHKGSEQWSVPIQLPSDIAKWILPFSKFFGQKLLNNEALNLPLPLNKIPKFSMTCELYQPSLTKEQLSTSADEKRQLLCTESEKIRIRMNDLLIRL